MTHLGSIELIAQLRGGLDRSSMTAGFNKNIDWESHGLHPAGVETVLVKRLLPKRNGRFDIEYELALKTGESPKLRRVSLFGRFPMLSPLNQPVRGSGFDPRVISDIFFDDEQLGATFHSADRDPAFPQFRRCLDGDFMGRLLLQFEGSGLKRPNLKPSNVGCKAISFRCGRRFVVQYSCSNGSAPPHLLVGKSYCDDRGQRLAELQRRLSAHLLSAHQGLVRVPDVWHYEPDLRMVFIEWAPGHSVGRVRRPATTVSEANARSAARALAAIHSAPVSGVDPFDAPHHFNTLQRWHETIVALHPELAPDSPPLLELLATAHQHLSADFDTLIHGDFYESQFIVTPTGGTRRDRPTVTIYDLDTLSIGDRCFDVGNYLAHQWLWCLHHGLDFKGYNRIVGAMLETYESAAGPLNESALAYYWAAALYRVGAIHAFRDGTSGHTKPLWALVPSVLSAGRKGLNATPAHGLYSVGSGPDAA